MTPKTAKVYKIKNKSGSVVHVLAHDLEEMNYIALRNRFAKKIENISILDTWDPVKEHHRSYFEKSQQDALTEDVKKHRLMPGFLAVSLNRDYRGHIQWMSH